jgi:hypothetical protein
LIFLDSFLLLLALCVCIYRDFTCPVLFSYSRPLVLILSRFVFGAFL